MNADRLPYGVYCVPIAFVEADTINIFKNRLDKYWSNQAVFYDFNANLTGTGDLPICI